MNQRASDVRTSLVLIVLGALFIVFELTTEGPWWLIAAIVGVVVYNIYDVISKRSSKPNDDDLEECNNVGLRCETEGEGEAYFISLFQNEPEPIIFYFFDTKERATEALLEVSCIAVAKDSGKLICTEPLTFGVFPAVDQDDTCTWGVLLAGKAMSHEIWSEARECFKKHSGRMRREDEPTKTVTLEKIGAGDPSLVKFTHERRDNSYGLAIYRQHTAPDRASALAWLQQHPVDKPSYFLVVETPEGTVARDIQGIYDA